MDSKKNILIFIDWFLPGTNSGGPVRSYANLIDHLGDVFNFYVVTRDVDYCSQEVYSGIISNAWNKWNNNTSIYYFSEKQLSIKTLRDLVQTTDFDIAYINGIYSWYFSILPLLLVKRSPHVIVSARGMLNPQAFSTKKTKKKFYLRMARNLSLFQGVTLQATNEDEKNFIKRELGENTQVVVAPNFPRRLNEYHHRHIEKEIGELKLINVARISKEKGTLFLINLLKDFDQGKVELDLYGPIYDHEYWEECKTAITELPKNVKVNYGGILKSDDVPKALVTAHFFILTSEGENFGHAILEALSHSIPVIISDQTPWQDLARKLVGWDISLEKKEEFQKVLLGALEMKDGEYKLLSNAAFDYAQKVIHDSSIYTAYERLFLSEIPKGDNFSYEETA